MPLIEIRSNLERTYPDVLTPKALAAIEAIAPLDADRHAVMAARIARRAQRARDRQPIAFLDPKSTIARTSITVQDARDGRFTGGEIPADLERQWIQGTGPAAKPDAPLEQSIRNVAYALLSGADGWMFDGEDALGQLSTMSLDNQRNLTLAIDRDPVFLKVAALVADEMNAWAQKFFGHPIVADWRQQLDFTTKIFRARGLHLDDRHIRRRGGGGFSASIVDMTLYVVNNHRALARSGASIVLYLPKIQTAEEAALWNDMMDALETHVGLARRLHQGVRARRADRGVLSADGGSRGARQAFRRLQHRSLGLHQQRRRRHGVGRALRQPEHRRDHDDLRLHAEVRRPRAAGRQHARHNGRFALWQGGMEPNIPVGTTAGVENGMKRAVAGAEREQREGASGKWVAHWKMVHIVRPVWERVGEKNQLGRSFPRLTYTGADADGLIELETAPRTIRGARDLVSVALQYGNAFGRGLQAAALKPADFFGNDDILYLMEDMATGEIRLSILWEWLHKRAKLTAADEETGVKDGDTFTADLFARLLKRSTRSCGRPAIATSTTCRKTRRSPSPERSSKPTCSTM